MGKNKTIDKEWFKIEVKNGKNCSNLPKYQKQSMSCKTHGRNAQDTYELPDGRRLTKQCFWLNNSYILSQLDKQFKE